jgi:hypothetical protein
MAKFKVGNTKQRTTPALQNQRQKLYAEKKEGVIKKVVKKRAATRKMIKENVGKGAEALHTQVRKPLSSDVAKKIKPKKKVKKK